MSAERLLIFGGHLPGHYVFVFNLIFQTLALQFESDRRFALSRPDGIVR